MLYYSFIIFIIFIMLLYYVMFVIFMLLYVYICGYMYYMLFMSCYVMLLFYVMLFYVLNVIYLSNLMGGKPGHKQREKLYNQCNNSAFYSTFLYNRDENMLMFFTAIDNQFTGINSFLVCGN